MAEHHAAERAEGDRTGLHADLTVMIRDSVAHAIDRGIDPDSADAVPVLDGLVGVCAQTFDALDSAEYRTDLLHRLEVANDPRAERYFQLLATINGWPVQSTLAPIFLWFSRGLRANPKP